jgi:iron only hydrogenase large subunit-like protein
MSDSDKLVELLTKKAKLVAMVAPSFPIMFEPGRIVGQLKALGFSYVVEVAVGAKKTNEQAVSILKNNPHTRFITSPCASFVRFMRTKHPDLLHHLAFEIDSPMVATAKIVATKWPDYKPVFIGPCVVKKLEAAQDHPELNILVLTYRELEDVLKRVTVGPDALKTKAEFDLSEPSTRIYPVDGGLTDSSGARSLLQDDEIRVVSGWKNCEAAVQEFAQNKKIRLMDILFCDGGCIMGPGVRSDLAIDGRKEKILAYSGH